MKLELAPATLNREEQTFNGIGETSRHPTFDPATVTLVPPSVEHRARGPFALLCPVHEPPDGPLLPTLGPLGLAEVGRRSYVLLHKVRGCRALHIPKTEVCPDH